MFNFLLLKIKIKMLDLLYIYFHIVYKQPGTLTTFSQASASFLTVSTATILISVIQAFVRITLREKGGL